MPENNEKEIIKKDERESHHNLDERKIPIRKQWGVLEDDPINGDKEDSDRKSDKD